MLKTKKTEAIAGIDIGSYSVKCVETARAGAGIELRRALIAPVNREADLKAILAQFDLASAGHVRIALSGPSVVTRLISMPFLNPRELQGAIRFEAESQIPFPIDECVLDHQVIRQDGVGKTMKVMLVAAKRDLVEARYKLLTELGIHPEAIDVDVFCLVNASETLGPESGEKSYGLLNVGHQVSSLAIIHEGRPVFVREIAAGGLGVTRDLAETKNISEAQADEMKIRKPAGETEALKAATLKGYESLTEEIRHSIDYVENEIKEEIGGIRLSGGGALAHSAVEILTQETGKPVAFWDNLKNMQVAKGAGAATTAEGSATLNIALGMTFRSVGVLKK